MLKNLPASAGDMDSISGSGRSPGGGNGNPLQYSCLENSMDRGAWRATVHEVAELNMIEHEHTVQGMPCAGTIPVVWWLRICLPVQGVWV